MDRDSANMDLSEEYADIDDNMTEGLHDIDSMHSAEPPSTNSNHNTSHHRTPRLHTVHVPPRKRSCARTPLLQPSPKRHRPDTEIDYTELWNFLPQAPTIYPISTAENHVFPFGVPSSALFPTTYTPHPSLSTYGINPPVNYSPTSTFPTALDSDYLASFNLRPAHHLTYTHTPTCPTPLDFFTRLSTYPELFLDLTLHLPLPTILTLTQTSKPFHQTLSTHLSHFTLSYAHHHFPTCSKLYTHHLYTTLCIPDPTGHIHPQTNLIRQIPSLRWLQMIAHRHRTTRDILALLAREHHRCPGTMLQTLRKMWLLMDISTNKGRLALMHNEDFFSDYDVYNMVFFAVKLDMFTSHPVAGPGCSSMREVLLGQRHLTPLRDYLAGTRYRTVKSVVELCARYELLVQRKYRGSKLRLFGIECASEDLGRGHLEGWGRGNVHLLRADELAMREGVRRRLGLERHLIWMVQWGYVDPVTKVNLEVSEEETYISDEEVGWRYEAGDDEEEEWSTDEDEDEEDDEDEDEVMEDDDDEVANHGFDAVQIENEMLRQEVLHDFPFL